jgi:GAF domain-containing protein
MEAPRKPENEAARLKALHDLGILDTFPEERYDRITRLAQRLFDVRIVAMSLVDSDRQWFKSIQGLDVKQTPRDVSFCGHALASTEPLFVVPDASVDERFADNPLVAGDPNIRFYAGGVLETASGDRLGTLCIIDDKPREPSPGDLQLLRDLADIVQGELAQVAFETYQQELEARLQSQREVDRFFSVALEMLCVADSDGYLKQVNPAFEKTLGYSKAELTAQPFVGLSTPMM